jgi:hypothetical protein
VELVLGETYSFVVKILADRKLRGYTNEDPFVEFSTPVEGTFAGFEVVDGRPVYKFSVASLLGHQLILPETMESVELVD